MVKVIKANIANIAMAAAAIHFHHGGQEVVVRRPMPTLMTTTLMPAMQKKTMTLMPTMIY